MAPFWRQHRPMLAQKNHLGASWAVLGALGRLLWGSWGRLGAPEEPRRFQGDSRKLWGSSRAESCCNMASWRGGIQRRGMEPPGSWDPLNTQKSEKPRTQCTEHRTLKTNYSLPSRRSAVADIQTKRPMTENID